MIGLGQYAMWSSLYWAGLFQAIFWAECFMALFERRARKQQQAVLTEFWLVFGEVEMSSGSMFPVSLEEQIAEIDREIRLREFKYPEWIKAGTLKKPVADRQMERIRAVRESLYRLKGLER